MARPPASLSAVPRDVLYLIVELLDCPSLIKLGRCNRELRKIVAADDIWKRNLIRKYGTEATPYLESLPGTWKTRAGLLYPPWPINATAKRQHGGLLSLFSKKRNQIRILVTGTSQAGKKALLEKLRGHFKCPSAATSHYVTFTHLDFILHLFIVSDATFEGSRSFFSEVDVVFYIANSDKMQKSRLPDVDFCNRVMDTLVKPLGLPVLIYANHQDLPNSMSVAQIADTLSLHSLRNRYWYIQACCVITSDGIFEGLDWLNHALKAKCQEKSFR